MLVQILLGTIVIFATIVLVVALLEVANVLLPRLTHRVLRKPNLLRAGVELTAVVVWVLASLSVAIWIWAAAFFWLGLFPTLEESVYFSLATFTTLGFGDVLAPVEWRLLSGMAATNGLLLFGLVTAFLIEQIRRNRLFAAPSDEVS